jgi:hypothetical protein
MKAYDKKEKFPEHWKSVRILGEMCVDIATHSILGVEYKSDKRAGRYGLRLSDKDIFEFYNPHNDGVMSHGGTKLDAVIGAECVYLNHFIFENENELWAWVAEWGGLTHLQDILELEEKKTKNKEILFHNISYTLKDTDLDIDFMEVEQIEYMIGQGFSEGELSMTDPDNPEETFMGYWKIDNICQSCKKSIL